jgi:hypothetical protein
VRQRLAPRRSGAAVVQLGCGKRDVRERHRISEEFRTEISGERKLDGWVGGGGGRMRKRSVRPPALTCRLDVVIHGGLLGRHALVRRGVKLPPPHRR